ncbi:UDP-glucose 4-epimerase GalE [Agrococcus sp. Marseille-Q4369]|uniref:UDP-glucose 4-epimerase GalE n=1 Tax=Agrococcus sp. Marseille-Q4369 TaxID=2810513 RepID=UPI001B8C0A5F|nr:UDP-glucose 4-epimerase GalE [Agrococcus sp. Marseille-Q4369]QUW19806.1 UDP-glucose 4-epimerase GalE [Agrococcus sp. Marseille-Q4369]
MRVLLTGGAGFIGSHTAIALVKHGHDVVILDDLSNASEEAVRRAERLAGAAMPLVVGDAGDAELVGRVLAEHCIDAVIHFAGLKAVGESVERPLTYYRVNLGTAIATLEAMATHGIRRFVFSSSATVYEQPGELLREDAPVGIDLPNPYGRTKAMIEAIIADAAAADPALEAAVLRYFNPVGAHPSGDIGEDPKGIPNNLMPFIAQVAAGERERLRVFGDDYPTVDGTGVRDYIHVLDLAEGHVAALEALEPGVLTVNLGTGRGASVLEVLRAFERAVGRELPFEVVERRVGDAGVSTADPTLAHERLGWRATRSLDDAVTDAWRWQERNPRGYRA